MARIEGVNLPREKRIEVALTYIYGIGLKTSQDILKAIDLNFDKRVKELTDKEVSEIQNQLKSYIVEGDLRKDIRQNIRRLQEINSYRGYRHKKSLPVRGQRTKTNARTRKGPRGLAVAGKKKVGKK
jgi:small subunit ribosomal protein S13